MSNEKSCASTSINWDNTANAKNSISVQKWTLYDINIFRNLIEIDNIPSNSTD